MSLLGRPLPYIILAFTVFLSFEDLLSSQRSWLLVLDDGDNFLNNRWPDGRHRLRYLNRESLKWAWTDGTLLGVGSGRRRRRGGGGGPSG